MAEVVVHSSHDSNPYDSNQGGGVTRTITRATAPGLIISPQYLGQQDQHLPGGPVAQQGTDSEQVVTHHITTQAPRPSRASINAERILMTQPTLTHHDDHGAQAHVTVVINPSTPGTPSSSRGNQNRRRKRGGRCTCENSQNEHQPTVPATPKGTTLSTHVSNASYDEAAVKRPNTIYEQHLVTKGLGFPLWTPQPNTQLAKEYRVKGATIGDVGIITKNGAFDFWFNICLARTDPINPPDLSEGFEQLQLHPGDTRGFREFTAGSHLTSSTVKQAKHAENSRRGTTFESSAAEGAVLSMPNGGYHEELNNITSFREYMATHIESWYQWAKRRGREVQNGDIRLVIGHNKATSWGMACFANTSKHQKCSLTFSQNEESERATGCPYAWEHTGTSVDVKAGPDQWDTQDLRQSNDPPLLNQCLFLRTLNALLSDDLWTSMQMHGAPALNVQGSANGSCNPPKSPKQNPTDNSGTSSSSRTTNSASRDQAPSQQRSQQEEERSYPEDTEYALRHSHPSYAINAWLLNEASTLTEMGRILKPKMVITDDSVWGALGSMVDALLDPSEDPDLVNRCFDQVLKSHNIEAIRSDSSVTMYLNPKDSTGQAHAQGLARVPALMGVSREGGDDNSSYSVVPIKSTTNVEAFAAPLENTKGVVFGPARENSIILAPPRHYVKGTASHYQQDEAGLHSGSHSLVLDLCRVFHLQNRRLCRPTATRSRMLRNRLAFEGSEEYFTFNGEKRLGNLTPANKRPKKQPTARLHPAPSVRHILPVPNNIMQNVPPVGRAEEVSLIPHNTPLDCGPSIGTFHFNTHIQDALYSGSAISQAAWEHIETYMPPPRQSSYGMVLRNVASVQNRPEANSVHFCTQPHNHYRPQAIVSQMPAATPDLSFDPYPVSQLPVLHQSANEIVPQMTSSDSYQMDWETSADAVDGAHPVHLMAQLHSCPLDAGMRVSQLELQSIMEEWDGFVQGSRAISREP